MSQNINMHCTLSKRASQTILFRPEFKDILLRLLIATFLFSRFLRHYQYNDLCIWAGHNQKSHTWPSKSSSTLQRAFCFVWNSALSILTLTRPHLLNQCDATTRSSWLNCDDEAVYWVSKGHYEAVAVGNWWYWVSRGHSCLYILQKVEIWTGVTDASLTTLKDRATQLLK